MKINRRKIIALITLVSMFMAYFIPAEGLTLLAPAPEIVIEVEEIDEPDTSGAEKSDKEEGSGNGSAVDEKEADNKDKPGSEPLTEAEKSDKEEGSAVSEKDADNKDKPDSGAPADTEKSEKEEAADKEKETDKPAETTEAPKDTEKPEKETVTEAVIDTEKPEKETSTEAVIDTEKPEEPKTEAPTETAKPETEKETAKPDVKNQTDLSIASDFVAEVDGTGYADMGEAIAAWANGNTLKLVADASYGSKIIFTNGAHTFDLNGKTFTRTVISDDGTVFDVNSGAKLTVTDTSTEKNGVITRQQGQYGGTVLFTRDSGSTINFNAGKITGMTSRVIITWQGSTVNMSGGEISGNTLNNGDATDGIVRTYSSNSSAGGTFNMTGGKIIDNVLGNGKTGGAVYVGSNGTFNLSGNAEISGNTQNGKELNVYLPSGKTISISGALADDTSVGVTMQSGAGVITSGLSGKGSAKNFTSDNSAYIVSQNADGEAELKADSHEHDGVSFTKWTSTDSLPAEAGNYCLAGDVTISSRWDVPSGETNLCLNGHAIIRTNAEDTTGSAIQVGSGANLTLYDCGTETRYYTVANPSLNGAGLGTVVDKSAYDAADENARGTFIGGYITGGNITGAADGYHLIGGGVNVDCGTFTMYGGTIIGNKVCINGGGVKVRGAGASFTMNGGAILANYNDCYGGAISIGDNNGSHLSTVTINGGTIARNWSGRNGGAFHPDGNGHVISITGGSIVNNYTNGNYENFHRSGGGVLVDGGNYKISGDPVIKDNLRGTEPNNVHLAQQSDVLDLSGHLASGAEVGVYVKGLTASTDIKVATGAQKEDIEYLHFDIPDEGKPVYCDGSKDWIYFDGSVVEYKNAHHTHEAGTVWATAYVAPSVAITANGTTDYYNSFGDAVNAWTDGSTLKLLENVSYGNRIILSDGTRTLDLNGKTLTRTVTTDDGTCFTVNGGAKLTVTDTSEEKNGVITRQQGNYGGSAFHVHDSGSTLDFKAGKLTGFTSRVIIIWQGSTVNMSGGEISGNDLNNGDATDGIVRTYSSNSSAGGVFNISGGKIINNTLGSGKTGGAVYVGSNGTLNLLGDVTISGNTQNGKPSNVYLPSDKVMNISGALADSTSVGVTMQSGTGVFTSGFSGNGAIENFTSDDSRFKVKLDSSGEAACVGNTVASVITGNNTVDYINFSEALKAWTDGSTLKLMDDVTDQITVSSGTKTLDLNDKSITYTGGSVIVVSGGNLTIEDSSENKTKHYYTPDPNGVAKLSETATEYSFEGGYITGGVASEARGGGIRIIGGNVDFKGGTIFANSAGWGGGAYTNGNGYFNISGSAAIIGNYSSGAYTSGGGIFCEGYNINMTAGSIRHNSAQFSGGGVRVCIKESDNAFFTMTGGEITGNVSGTKTGSGLALDMATRIKIGGSARITGNADDNFFIKDGGYFTIIEPMTEDALICFRTQNAPTTGNPVVISYESASTMGDTDYKNCFKCDDGYNVYKNGDGELIISNAPPALPGVTVSDYEGDYDGNAHSITVSVPEGAAVKYGEAEGSYTLTENPSYTDAGTYTVYYEVSKEGFDPAVGSATVKIDKVDAAITTAPVANELIADGTAQELISAGAANGGTIYYALSRDSSASPADSEYKTELPKATDAGAYYVWYLVKGDKNHNDLTPAYVKVTLAEQDWVIISGVVYDSSKTPVANVTVNLTQGSKVVDTIKSDANGGYYFKVPTGLYNLVVKTDNSTTTCKKDISESLTYDIDLLDAGTETALDIIDSDKDVVVDGLNDEARSVREGDNVPADQNVSVKLTVKGIPADGTEGAKTIAEKAPDKNLEYYDLKVEKSVASTVTTLEETQNVLEIAIPCSFTNKRELTAYDYSASGVKTLTESSSGEAGTFRVDKSNNIMYVYLNHFSTVGIGYKPYYRVKSNVTLGSFKGKVSVALKKEGSDERFELKDVSLDAISFTDIPKGSYQMTLTWKDGAEHTLTLPVTIK